MKCSECRDHMPALALGELTEEQRREIEGHLGDCPSCRAEFEQLRRICGILDGDARGDSLSELEKLRLESAVYRRLAAETVRMRLPRSRIITTLTRLAAAIVLFVLGYTVHSYITGLEQTGAVRHVEQANPSLAEYDLNLSGGLRFSAAGLKAIAQGRKAALAQLAGGYLQKSEPH